jgi:hypothetical protein
MYRMEIMEQMVLIRLNGMCVEKHLENGASFRILEY